MKRIALVIVTAVISWLILLSLAVAQCPYDTVDLGICDTLYIQCYDCDLVEGPPPWNVHFNLLVTHDLAVSWDSIQGFVVPLSFSGDCSFPLDSNTTDLSGPGLSSSIFRDFGGMENRMLDLEQLGGGESWDTRTVNIDNPAGHFFVSLSASGVQDREWWEGSGTLLATLTLTVTDTTTVYIDTTFWPKGTSLSYIRSDGKSYVPRQDDPGCFFVGIKPGDTNRDGHLGLGDVIYLVNYLYKGGPPPDPLQVGDINNDGVTNVADPILLLNYLCQGGLAPKPCYIYH